MKSRLGCRYGERAIGVAQWSFLQDSPQLAHIYGTRGHITMERVHCPEKLTITRSGDAGQVLVPPP